jgi:hypothetical protein
MVTSYWIEIPGIQFPGSEYWTMLKNNQIMIEQ